LGLRKRLRSSLLIRGVGCSSEIRRYAASILSRRLKRLVVEELSA
jgi:hypothetical protein